MPCSVGGGNEMFLVYAAEENDLLAESGGFFPTRPCAEGWCFCVLGVRFRHMGSASSGETDE